MKPSIIFYTIVFTTAWNDLHCHACQGDLPQEVVVDWLKKRILEGLRLDKPPLPTLQSPTGQRVHVAAQYGAWRIRREAWLERKQHQEISQVILFPNAGQLIHIFILNLNILLFRLEKNAPFFQVCFHAQNTPLKTNGILLETRIVIHSQVYLYTFIMYFLIHGVLHFQNNNNNSKKRKSVQNVS